VPQRASQSEPAPLASTEGEAILVDGGRLGVVEGRRKSLLQTLLSLLAAEHVCVPPDVNSGWVAISEQRAEQLEASTYVCPECGQHMARSESLKKAA
jgi:hypothetical protein